MIGTGLLMAAAISWQGAAATGPVPVKVVRENGEYRLLRGGKPYFVRGVGGSGRMKLLKELGGNSMRTWGADGQFAMLDEAQSLGLTITIGIWLGHKEHGFDYNDSQQVAKQFEQAKMFVEAYKNHPALLFWGLGNEMETSGNDTEQMWRAVNDIAKMVKAKDPNHPTMTVVADVDQGKIDRIKRFAPDIDILGVNTYGGALSVAERLRQHGWDKPYVLTEFGPYGPWERPKTSWGASLEQTSTEKAECYRAVFEKTIAANPGHCLGSYAFLWGDKDEGTPTWYGMFLPTGEQLGAIDVLSYAWAGKRRDVSAPKITAVQFDGAEKTVVPGAALKASVKCADQTGLMIKWRVCPDNAAGILQSYDGASIQLEAPATPGNYRLFVYVFDGKNHAAVANAPFRVAK